MYTGNGRLPGERGFGHGSVPGIVTSVEDRLVGVPDGVDENVAAQIVPYVLSLSKGLRSSEPGQPAASRISRAMALTLTHLLISARCLFMASTCAYAKPPPPSFETAVQPSSARQPCAELFVERVFRREHIVLRRDADMGGALRDQPIGERRSSVFRAVQGKASIGSMDAPSGEGRLRFREEMVFQLQNHGRDLAGGARFLLRRDARENDAGGFAGTRTPIGANRRHEIGLRAQNRTVVENFERIGGKCRAGRRNIDDELGLARRWCALGRAKALDDAVIGDMPRGEKAPGQMDIFGRDAHPLAAPRPE